MIVDDDVAQVTEKFVLSTLPHKNKSLFFIPTFCCLKIWSHISWFEFYFVDVVAQKQSLFHLWHHLDQNKWPAKSTLRCGFRCYVFAGVAEIRTQSPEEDTNGGECDGDEHSNITIPCWRKNI